MIYLGLAAVFRSEKERPVLPYMGMDEERTTTERKRLYSYVCIYLYMSMDICVREQESELFAST